MSHTDRIYTILKSQSLDSLHIQYTTDTSMLTSTKIQSSNIKVSSNNNRRKAILPISHQPKNRQDLLIMNTNKESHNAQKTKEIQENRSRSCDSKMLHEVDAYRDESFIQAPRASVNIEASEYIENSDSYKASHQRNNPDERNKILQSLNQHKNAKKTTILNRSDRNYNFENNSDSQSQNESEKDDESFDEFILGNFIPFTGRQSVLQWLDETETKFNRFRIVRNLRYVAIPLLVEGEARYKYMRHRREIQSFDDFYEFLLIQYDKNDEVSKSSKFYRVVDNKSHEVCTYGQAKILAESRQSTIDNSNVTNGQHQLFISTGNAVANVEATNNVGENSVAQSAVTFDRSTDSESDQTLSDLRKAIVGDLIKNPKTFKGNKDDVNKWIEEIEHLLDVAHISDTIRLDIISYSLRGDALEWFKNNRQVFTSWKIFVMELKRAFTSTFHGELAFKALELYTQGENQSIRSFFNEVLKLCKEADTTMSEATKLKTLLNKAKPSIQFEVRKKKPTSTSEFLEYAKEAEELLQLSNIGSNHSINDNHNMKPISPISSQWSTPLIPMRQSFEHSINHNANRYPRYTNNDYRFSNSRSNYHRPTVSYQHSRSNTNSSQGDRNFCSANQQKGIYNSTNPNRKSFPASQTSAKPNNYSRKNIVNAIDLSTSSDITNSFHETYTASPRDQGHDIGHQASAESHF